MDKGVWNKVKADLKKQGPMRTMILGRFVGTMIAPLLGSLVFLVLAIVKQDLGLFAGFVIFLAFTIILMGPAVMWFVKRYG